MKLLVVSDTHGSLAVLEDLVSRFEGDAAALFFCGDGEKEVALVQERHPHFPIYAVRGNNDSRFHYPSEQVVRLDNRTIFLTHGHRYHVGFGEEQLYDRAKKVGAELILYGHTHRKTQSRQNNITCINPGSPVRPRDGVPSYAVVDLALQGIVCQFMRYERRTLR